MNSRAREIEDYAAAVREALAGVPEPDRDELLEDLEEHLTEVAAESTDPLVTRLGPPESYAAELRVAYGAGSLRAQRGPAWISPRHLRRRLTRLVEDGKAYRAGGRTESLPSGGPRPNTTASGTASPSETASPGPSTSG